MLGDMREEEEYGLMLRFIDKLFKNLEESQAKDKEFNFTIFCSFFEIYCEKVYDLVSFVNIIF